MNNKVIAPADFSKVFTDLMKYRKLYFVSLTLALVVSLVYAYSLPSVYKSTIKLAPEVSPDGFAMSAYNLSILGFRMEKSDKKEAIYPIVYPILINNVEFKTSLFPIKVKRESDDKSITYYEYLLTGQKVPWWIAVKRKVSKFIVNGNEPDLNVEVNPFRLTLFQSNLIDHLNNLIKCEINKQSWVITISVTDQDPLIAATMSDSVASKLQDFIYKYRTAKAQNEYEYYKRIYNIAKKQYEKSKKQYVRFADTHRDLTMTKGLQQLKYLEEEMTYRYNTLVQYSNDITRTKNKIQEMTPAFTTLQTSSVPIEESGPYRLKICMSILSFVFYAITIWVLYKENDFKTFFTQV